MSRAYDLIENLKHLHQFDEFKEGSIGHNAAWVLVERIKELEERLKDIPCERYVAADRVCESVAELQIENEGLEERINDMQATFDLRHAADMRGVKLWREERPDRDLKMPDHGDLVLWLLAYIEGLNVICNCLIEDKNSIIDSLEQSK